MNLFGLIRCLLCGERCWLREELVRHARQHHAGHVYIPYETEPET